MNALAQVEAFFTYFVEYYDSQYDLIQMVNKNPQQFTHHDQFMSLYYEARKTLWAHNQQLEFMPPTFSADDGEKIAKLFKNRIYYTAYNTSMSTGGTKLSAKGKRQESGGTMRTKRAARSKSKSRDNSSKVKSRTPVKNKSRNSSSKTKSRTRGGAQAKERQKLANVHMLSFSEQIVTQAHKTLLGRLIQ